MQFSSYLLIALACAVSRAWAFPHPNPQLRNPPNFNFTPPPPTRRPFQLNLSGGGSSKQGFDLSLKPNIPVWQSHNGRHSLDATGQYSQHFGGPYGNSRPNWNVGPGYKFNF